MQASSAPLVQKMSDLSTDCVFSCILLPFAAWHRPPVSPWNLCFTPHQWEGHGTGRRAVGSAMQGAVITKSLVAKLGPQTVNP